jgi:predicted RNase H-like nuclease (RuvC/YqgF family)
MAGSEIPDSPSRGENPSAESVIDRLEAAVNRLIADYEELRAKAADSEHSYRRLTDALQQSESDPLDSADVQGKIQRLADENDRLRQTLDEARERADRIRSRLFMVEDEL